jgi:hypothetical protein
MSHKTKMIVGTALEPPGKVFVIASIWGFDKFPL